MTPRPSSRHGWLLLGDEASPETHWQAADPTDPETDEALRRLRYSGELGDELVTVRKADIYRALHMAETWAHFSTYELGVEHVIRQLREVWRALRFLERESSAGASTSVQLERPARECSSCGYAPCMCEQQ